MGTGGPSVVVEVRDQAGRPAATGTTIVIQDGAYRDSVDGANAWSALSVGAGERRPGRYEVRLYKAYHKPVVLKDVMAPGDSACKYAEPTDIRRVTLELVPGAPLVRSVVVLPPGAGLGGPRYTLEAYAIVDASTGTSRAVRWSSSDTSVVRIVPTSDTSAIVCPRPRDGNVQIVATSRADPRVRGAGRVSVMLSLGSTGRSAIDSLNPVGACRR